MPSLILVRHGQASFGGDDYDVLSELGERQAQIAAEDLAARGLNVTHLWAGGLKRQQQTAAPIAAALGLEIESDPRWNEYDGNDLLAAHSTSTARLDGEQTVTSRMFQDILERGLRDWAAAGDDSAAEESWPAFRARVDAALMAAVGALGSGETGIAVTSAGAIAAACTSLLHGSIDTYLQLNRVGVNAATTTVTSGASGQTMLSFNDHGHLRRAGDGLITFR